MDARDTFAGAFDDFVANRKEVAAQLRAAGDSAGAKLVLAWRKPTRGAWLVNLISRHRREKLAEVLDLGQALAQAHRQADAGRLRELSRLRTQLIAVLTQQAVELGRDRDYVAPEAVRAEVAETLTAGLADPEVAEALRAGTMSRTVRASGFGPADLFAPLATVIPLRPAPTDQQAEPTPAADTVDPVPPGDKTSQRLSELAVALEDADAKRETATQESEVAHRDASRAAEELARAVTDRERASQQVMAAREALTRAEKELDAAAAAAQQAGQVHAAAERSARETEQRVAGLVAQADSLRAEIAELLGG